VTTPASPLPPSRGPHYYATSPRPTRPIGTFAPYWPHAPYSPYSPYYPYSPYGGRYDGYRRLPGLAPLIIILPTVTTVERSSTTYEPGYDDVTYAPGYAPEYQPGYAPAPEPRVIEGVVPAAARSLVVEMPADSLLRVRWSGDDRGVVEVALVVADAERRVLATQAVLDPPYTALFDRPARAAYAGVTLTYADGASTTILQPLAAPAAPARRPD
jgi:hypothetical protein